jgi:hypothetical protein
MSVYSGIGDKDRFITVHLEWVLVGSDLVMGQARGIDWCGKFVQINIDY